MKLFALCLCLLPALSLAQYDYGEVLGMSILFYEAQRSGPLPSDNRIDWRGDSAVDDEVPGGYYDAGDHVKFGFPMAAMTTQLAWGGVTFQGGYDNAGETDNFLAGLRWSTDYFIGCTNGDSFVGQIGDGDSDHAYWGRPEDMTMARPAFTVTAPSGASELLGETAAALAAASIVYGNNGDDAASSECLDTARTLFGNANQYRDTYVNSIPAGNFYNSYSGYGDELVWGAAWIAKATGDAADLELAESLWDEQGLADKEPHSFDWDDKSSGANVLLLELTGNDRYRTKVEQFVSYVLNQATYSPGGMIYVDQWGSLRHAANLAHIMLQIAELGIEADACRTFATNQINYALGDGGRSYVIGYGNNPPERPHHRSSSCPDMPETCDWDDFYSSEPNPQTLTGALVGGPDQSDNYVDDREDYQSNEVATDYNAGFQSALAGLNA